MSVASEFAPEVFIPARARDRRATAAHGAALRLVTPVHEAAWSAVPRPTVESLSVRPAAVSRPLVRREPAAPSALAPVRLLRGDRSTRIVACPAAPPRVDAGRGATLAAPLTVARRSAVRLTRRGTVVLSVAVLGLGALMLLVAHFSAGSAVGVSSTTTVSSSVNGHQVTVQAGDTLWSIAQRVAPNRDPRPVVSRLRSVNHLDSVSLTPGQTLNVG